MKDSARLWIQLYVESYFYLLSMAGCSRAKAEKHAEAIEEIGKEHNSLVDLALRITGLVRLTPLKVSTAKVVFIATDCLNRNFRVCIMPCFSGKPAIEVDQIGTSATTSYSVCGTLEDKFENLCLTPLNTADLGKVAVRWADSRGQLDG